MARYVKHVIKRHGDLLDLASGGWPPNHEHPHPFTDHSKACGCDEWKAEYESLVTLTEEEKKKNPGANNHLVSAWQWVVRLPLVRVML